MMIKKKSKEELKRNFNVSRVAFIVFFCYMVITLVAAIYTSGTLMFIAAGVYMYFSILFVIDMGVSLIQLEIRELNKKGDKEW